jgi:hypothetical protein
MEDNSHFVLEAASEWGINVPVQTGVYTTLNIHTMISVL